MSSKKRKLEDEKDPQKLSKEQIKRREKLAAWKAKKKKAKGEPNAKKAFSLIKSDKRDKKLLNKTRKSVFESAASANAAKAATASAGDTNLRDESEVDPLDAYMQEISEKLKVQKASGSKGGKPKESRGELIYDGGGNESDEGDGEYDWLGFGAETDKSKGGGGGRNLPPVDHEQMNYEPFRKNLFREPAEIAAMSDADVAAYRLGPLENTKVRGGNRKDCVKCPRPITKFSQCGFTNKLLDELNRLGFETPTPIQAQAMPAIMAGRDVIGIASTGSGKTLAFLLPMFRHLGAQRALRAKEGPVGLILCPTRELCLQTTEEAKKFTGVLGIRSVAVYGGAPVAPQIARLKRGAEIVVATPGRFIELLCLNNGRVTNLRRVTMVILDEADRMFDMGFQPQIERILDNVRPERQTAMFTATFPRTIEQSARKMLHKPVEITVGGRTRVASTVEQHVEVLPDAQRYARLLQLVQVQARSKSPTTLVFVDRKEAADQLKARLVVAGVSAGALHSSIDQEERDFTLDDFKRGELAVLVATSVAARGLDVEHLNLVINYDVPPYVENYVQRVGRTGRAGRKGVAYTFIQPDEAHFAGEVVRALRDSKADVPEDLLALAQLHEQQKAAGEVVESHSSGYGGKGYSFTANEREKFKKARKKEEGGLDDDDDDADADDDEDNEQGDEAQDNDADVDDKKKKSFVGSDRRPHETEEAYKARKAQEEVEQVVRDMKAADAAKRKAAETRAAAAATAAAAGGGDSDSSAMNVDEKPALAQDSGQLETTRAALQAAILNRAREAKMKSSGVAVLVEDPLAAAETEQVADNPAARAAQFAAALNKKASAMAERRMNVTSGGLTVLEIEINDYSQNARYSVCHREKTVALSEAYNCQVLVRGLHVEQGQELAPGQRKLHIRIKAQNPLDLDACRQDIMKTLEEATQTGKYKKYSV